MSHISEVINGKQQHNGALVILEEKGVKVIDELVCRKLSIGSIRPVGMFP